MGVANLPVYLTIQQQYQRRCGGRASTATTDMLYSRLGHDSPAKTASAILAPLFLFNEQHDDIQHYQEIAGTIMFEKFPSAFAVLFPASMSTALLQTMRHGNRRYYGGGIELVHCIDDSCCLTLAHDYGEWPRVPQQRRHGSC
jgi:hypothetical protein